MASVSDIAKGFTITGFRLAPTLNYGINHRSRLRAGMDLTLFAGMDSLYSVRPILSLIYMPTRWLLITAGTINGGYHHDLGLPAYDPARWITNPVENGLQIETDTRLWNSDTWLDWEHYLKPWTPDQERFTMGSRHEFSVFRSYQQYFTKLTVIGASLQYIGRRTLDIYLIHFFFMPNVPIIGMFFDKYRHNFVLDTTISVAMALLIIGFCCISSNILRVSPFFKKWLFGRS